MKSDRQRQLAEQLIQGTASRMEMIEAAHELLDSAHTQEAERLRRRVLAERGMPTPDSVPRQLRSIAHMRAIVGVLILAMLWRAAQDGSNVLVGVLAMALMCCIAGWWVARCYANDVEEVWDVWVKR